MQPTKETNEHRINTNNPERKKKTQTQNKTFQQQRKSETGKSNSTKIHSNYLNQNIQPKIFINNLPLC